MRASGRTWVLMGLAFLLVVIVYRAGLTGGWLFDDYPNIVDNRGVQPAEASVSSLVRAALSSPSSEFKRPLASLSFAANYLLSGLDPYWMKVTNLLIHLLNGLLVFLLARRLFPLGDSSVLPGPMPRISPQGLDRDGLLAALVATAWMVLPINLTGVLYVVQRMESMANAFVLLGLLGYVAGRQRMMAGGRGLLLCAASVTVPAILGLLAKETAVMLPLYACLIEWVMLRFQRTSLSPEKDARVPLLFTCILAIPLAIGLAWMLPRILSPAAFATRDFTLSERLFSEARIVVDYIVWSLLPTPEALSFYHDDFKVSTGLLTPWSTLASMVVLVLMAGAIFWFRRRRPLVALGLALYLGCHLLTGTILPLELVYEHRNYFASLGLLLAIVPLLAAPGRLAHESPRATTPGGAHDPLPMPLLRYALMAGLLVFWMAETALSAYAWGSPLRLAEELAARAPESPRAQYELGRTYIILSHYDPQSPFTQLAYAPLERAMNLPDSSILPEQALIFMNARIHRPLKGSWWDSIVAKLKARKPGVQDESSLGALTKCQVERLCDLPKGRMVQAFLAAISHPRPSARVLAMYGDYAWNVLGDHELGRRMTADAVETQPAEPAYRITLVRMLLSQGRSGDARQALEGLQSLNVGGRLDADIAALRSQLP
ncbi:hypothetical protein ACFWZ4_09055 [Frateuria sp. GZRe12]|uniref:hypothetical protein n=1 Tax=Frateuria sp. GZRe12 TaxID=3351533 RepID=UPI003EDC4C0C